jgi:predicted ATPase
MTASYWSSCEHIVADVAAFAEAVGRSPGPARVLATSREPLRARGERVHRVPPLDLPKVESSKDNVSAMADASKSSAIKLFVDRADACLGGYDLTEEDASFVVDICSRLDGIPLAIELAASRLETMGVEALAVSLRNGFRVLSRGTRTALPRHRTLRATMDWSYDLLSEEERRTLQALSLARGWFTMDVVATVACWEGIEDIVDDLVAKSLIVADTKGRRTRFRLLDTTRHYAAEKLAASGRGDDVLRSTALFLTRLFSDAEEEMLSVPLEEWTHDYGQHLSLIRTAAEWAFGENGDTTLGVDLVVAALPLFFRLTLMEESTHWATRAISVLEPAGSDAASLLKLHAAVGWPAMRSTKGPDKGIEAWTKVLNIAEKVGDVDFQLRAVWALWVDAVTSAQPRKALEIAERFSVLARNSGDPVDMTVAKRLAGTAMHWLGRHREARDLLLEMLGDLRAIPHGTASGRYHLDQGVTARITLARCYWMLGDRDTAFAEVEAAVNEALAIKHEVSLTHVLAEAGCPLAILDGKLDLAKEYTSLLLDHTESLSLDLWQTYARCFEAEIAIAEGRAAEGLPQLCAGLRELERAGFDNFRSMFQLAEARGLAQLGQIARAIEVLDAALLACAASGERWSVPELLRVKGRIILQEDGPGTVERASRHFKEALETAKKDGAVAWEASILSELGQKSFSQQDELGHSLH